MQEFFNNVSRYPRYFITITLGIFFFLFDQLKPFINKPITAIALIGLIIGTFAFLTLTLQAMLGINTI
ncbi:MAG: DUF751 family protein [Trichodesmium sp. St15_bin1_1]|jgi:hypothetical protein|nr:DUF751 family protein [Trichodesmium sp. MAG_R02]MDE5084702.1 DUF751 family protein [Trichodesmium sp. St18_bin1]MDE5088798.1 DUF751 family protein [Trichodesmium sp. St16_bin2-tuft]MDE5108512.1 DUF751 family protein [Trichodesmium sp. St17_bin3_1_1]MDE5113925.1 DUF751 family protein [Trichodesmium sp. St15_bin1_1]MDE5120857.1 DUF751 family protein [Trichodesmium sp. St19_bin1]